MNKTRLMITVISLIVAVVAFCAVGCSAVSFDLTQGQTVSVGEEAYQYLELFATPGYADRSADTGNDLEFAKYLAQKLSDWGYTPKDVESNSVAGIQRFNYYLDGSDRVYSGSSYNVIFDKPAQSESKERILLTAQYDNRYSYSGISTGADGSYESGASIAALLVISRLLSQHEFDFDITIAFLGCSTVNYNGAEQMVKDMSEQYKKDILLSIDISNIIGGDYNYLYTIDKSTDYGSFFDELAKVNSLDFKSVPKDKKVGQASLFDNGLYNYFHVGMLSNNMYLMNEGVPTLTITSFNWDKTGNSGRVEMDGKESLLQTPADTFANMVERVGEEKIKSSFDSIINVVYLALTQEGDTLVQALQNSKEQMPSRLAQSSVTNSVLTVAPKMIILVALLLIMLKVRKLVNDDKDKYLAMKKVAEPQKPIDVFGFDTPDDSGNNGTDKNDKSDGVFDGF
ncbi:MAG: M28 family peptidase [Christensenellales bacterium]